MTEDEKLNEAIKAVLATTDGQRLFYWLLSLCQIYSDPFTGDDAATNYQLGLQSVGRRLVAKLDQINPVLYPTLLLEQANIRLMDLAAKDKAETLENDDDLD